MSDGVADDQIKAFFERWQRLEEEKGAISGDLRELFAEMKANGFDTKVARAVFRDKTKDQNARSEFEAIYDLYWSALGTGVATGARSARSSSRSNGRFRAPSDIGDGTPSAGMGGEADRQLISSPVNDSGQGEADGAFRPGNHTSVPSAPISHGQPSELAG